MLAYEEGAVTVTTETIYTGFGLEGFRRRNVRTSSPARWTTCSVDTARP